MSSSPHLGLAYLSPQQSQKHVTVNEGLRRLDQLVQMTVKSRTTTAQPASPADGDAYILPSGKTGAQWGPMDEGAIAAFQDGAWMQFTPRTGWRAYVEDDAALYVRRASGAWETIGAAETAAKFGVNTTADTTTRLQVKADAALFSHDDVTPGTGDHRLKVNKSASSKTATVLFQDGFSGRAEFGLAGDDDFHVKVSADGSTWKEAVVIDRSSGAVSFPFTTVGAIGANLLINGDFLINQRNFGGGSLSAGVFGFDRWKAATGGASASLSGLTLTLSSGELEQVVEPSVFGYSSFASLAVTVSVEAPSADLTVTFGSQSGTITAGSGRRSATLTLGAGDTGNLSFKIRKASGSNVTFGRVKLEAGAAATGWAARERTAELALCRRYYCHSFPDATTPADGVSNLLGFSCASGATAADVIPVTFPVPMRTTPTMTYYAGPSSHGSPASGQFAVYVSGTGWVGAINTGSNTTSPFRLSNVGVIISFATSSAILTTGGTYMTLGNWAASAEL